MINFVKYRVIYLIISLAVIVPGIISLFRHGLEPAIDFTGGTEVEYQMNSVSPEQIKSAVSQKFSQVDVEQTSGQSYLIRLPALNEVEKSDFEQIIKSLDGEASELRFETLGPILGKELLRKTFLGLILATVLILAYIAMAFRSLKFGVCATLATIHDTVVVLGAFSIFGQKYGVRVDSLFVTALLTVLSFSVHDTIVVFDRIRELAKIFKNDTSENLINKAVNETMIRSLNNSLTIIFMLVALILMGGESIRWFVIALLIGTVSGTYSSPFVATPLLLLWEKLLGPKK